MRLLAQLSKVPGMSLSLSMFMLTTISLFNDETMLTHLYSLSDPTSVMQMFFANQSCDPFTAESQPCKLGNFPSYAVNVSCAADIVAAVNFARNNNIRFVIKNTGHE